MPGKTLAQLHSAAEYHAANPDKVTMFVCRNQAHCKYAEDLAKHHGIAEGIRFVNIERAAEKSRGIRGRAFVDHAATYGQLPTWKIWEALEALEHLNRKSQ